MKVEDVPIKELVAHPRNYRQHPEDQLVHLMESLREHGVYRPIVIAQDGVILAGHGVVEAAKRLGWEAVPVIRLGVSSEEPGALKVLLGDNEIARLAEVDDKLLSEILRELKDNNDVSGLLGTGFDDLQLAALVMITRPESEIQDFNEAAEWVGMPEFEPIIVPPKVVISFRSEEDRQRFIDKYSDFMFTTRSKTFTAWWPPRPRRDLIAVKLGEGEGEVDNG